MVGSNVSIVCNFVSLNVKGIREKSKRQKIFEWCRDKRTDIIFLQETYSTRDIEDNWKQQWSGSVYFSHGTCHSKGVIILIDSKLDAQILKVITDEDGRFIIMECVVQILQFPDRESVS